MRVLITGALGFAGGYLCSELHNSDPSLELWGTANASSKAPSEQPSSLLPGLQILSGDLTDDGFVREIVAESKPDLVFHLAGFASGAGTDRDRIFRINVDASVKLLNELSAIGRPARVLLASSGYVYGPTPIGEPAREDSPLNPFGAYAESKAEMESAARAAISEDGPLSVIAVRSFNHTGPRQTTEFVVPAFARQIARIERGLEPAVVRVGNLSALRDFLDVRDVVRAYRLLLQRNTETIPFRAVNVASGKGISIHSILDDLIALSTTPLTVETDPNRMRASDIPESVGDSSLLTQLTGWQPEISLKDTVADTLDFWRRQVAFEQGLTSIAV